MVEWLVYGLVLQAGGVLLLYLARLGLRAYVQGLVDEAIEEHEEDCQEDSGNGGS